MKNKIVKGLLIFIGSVFTLWFLAPIVSKGIINIGSITGIVLFGGILLIGLYFDKFTGTIKNICKNNLGKAVFSFVCLILGIALGVVAAATACMISAAENRPNEDATLIVLGCKVNGDRPSRMLSARLAAAYEYLSENPDTKCVVSGGQGPDEGISEAECMYRYLVDKGIDKSRIYKEDKSTSTRENLDFSMKIIKENSLSEVCAIATNDYHEYRAGMIAKELGIKAYSVPGKTEITLLPPYYVREIYAILYEWIL